MPLPFDLRKELWRRYPRFGVVDRLYLASGPIGIVLLFVDWRLGLAVLLIGLPVLWVLSRRERVRAMKIDMGLVDDTGRPLSMEELGHAPIGSASGNAAGDFARSMGNSMTVMEQVGADWPERNPYGSSMVEADIRLWDARTENWRRGSIVAVLTAGSIVPEPNLRLEVFEGDECLFSWGNATWLVDRLDLDYSVPAHELRGHEWDGDKGENVPQRVLFVVEEPGLLHIADYLDRYGPDIAYWIDTQPEDWDRLAPPDPNVPASDESPGLPDSTPEQGSSPSTSPELSLTDTEALGQVRWSDPVSWPTDERAAARDEFVAGLPSSMTADEMYEAWIAHAGNMGGGALAGRVREAKLEMQAVAEKRSELHGP